MAQPQEEISRPRLFFCVNVLTHEQMFGTLFSCWGRGVQPSRNWKRSTASSCLAMIARVDLKRLRVVIDGLEGEAAAEARASQLAGDHHAAGNQTVVGWLSRLCGMSATSTADRLCVGKQLESLPKIAEALRDGAISYQSASVLCHLRDQLGDKAELFDEDEMLEHARNFSVGRLRYLCRYARHVADPDGFFNDAEADFSNRRLEISQMGDGMFCVDAILDPVNGAAFKTALESLAKRLGPDDERSHKQRMADSLGELVHHAMDEGRLPRRNGVRPHLNLTTHARGLEERARRAAGRPRALAPDLHPDAGPPRLRLHGVARPAGGLDGDRCRAGDAGGVGADAASFASQRSRLSVPRLRSQRRLVAPASHNRLGEARSDQAVEPGPALLLPPSPRA